jgi:hypothetical protein
MTKKKTVEFEDSWADELGLSDEDVEALMEGITQLVEKGYIEVPDDKETRH